MIILILVVGLLVGFASGSYNATGCVKTTLEAGVYVGVILGFAFFLGEKGWMAPCCIFASVVSGSLIAAITPNDNVIKRFYNRCASKRQGRIFGQE